MSEPLLTYDLALLDQSLAKWRSSPALRAVYGDIYQEMGRALAPGRILEIGSGIGVARDYFPGLVTSDVVATPFVDRAVSAYEIPDEGWGNIIAMDVLHHLPEPMRFFASAARALGPGGRIVLAEPAGTAWGCNFYRWFHHEPCLPHEVKPPFQFTPAAGGEFANMGMAQALFSRGAPSLVAAELAKSGLSVVRVRYRDLFAYPATGGFSHSSLLPAGGLRALLAVERPLPQALLRFLALRMIVVIEKKNPA